MNRRIRYTAVLLTLVAVAAGLVAVRRGHQQVVNQRTSIAQLKATGAGVRMAVESRSMVARKLWWLPSYTPVGDVQAGDVPNFGDKQLGPVLALPEVSVLELQNTNVTDIGIQSLAAAELPKLRSINLSGTSLSGPGLLALASFPSLTDVSVANCNQLTTADVVAFRKQCRHFVRLHGLY